MSKQEHVRVVSKLEHLTNKFVALEQENQGLLGDLQEISIGKASQYKGLSKTCIET